MNEMDRTNIDHPKKKFALLFAILEFVFFALFYFSQDSNINHTLIFHIYIFTAPVIIVLLILVIPELRKKVKSLLSSKDLVIFVAVLSIWLYVYDVKHIGVSSVFSFLYYPVILEELNFRFIVIEFLKNYTSDGKAIICQALMYTLFYASFVIFYPHGYPGLYAPLFILDNFAMAIIYGAIYYLRKNIYLTTALHLSFYLLLFFLPLDLGWLGYVTTPV